MNALKNLRIGIKLSLSYLIMFLLMTVLAYNGYSGARIIENKLEDVLHVRLTITNLLLNSDRDFQQLLVAERTLLSSDAKSDLFNTLRKDYEENLSQVKERAEKAFLLLTTASERELADKFRTDLATWETESRKVLAACQANNEKGRAEAISVSLGQAATEFENSRNHLDKLNDMNDAIIAETAKQASEAYSRIVSGIMILLFVAMVVAVSLGYIITRGITVPISQGVLLAEEISRGIFSRRLDLKTQDEVGQLGLSLDLMAENLAKNAGIADKIAEGNLNVEVKLASDNDQLGLALKKWLKPSMMFLARSKQPASRSLLLLPRCRLPVSHCREGQPNRPALSKKSPVQLPRLGHRHVRMPIMPSRPVNCPPMPD